MAGQALAAAVATVAVTAELEALAVEATATAAWVVRAVNKMRRHRSRRLR